MAIVTGDHEVSAAQSRASWPAGDYAVVINYAKSQPVAEAAVEVLAANGRAVAVRADVADELDVERLFGETIDAFGGVDVVVHAAGRGTWDGRGLRPRRFDALHRRKYAGNVRSQSAGIASASVWGRDRQLLLRQRRLRDLKIYRVRGDAREHLVEISRRCSPANCAAVTLRSTPSQLLTRAQTVWPASRTSSHSWLARKATPSTAR